MGMMTTGRGGIPQRLGPNLNMESPPSELRPHLRLTEPDPDSPGPQPRFPLIRHCSASLPVLSRADGEITLSASVSLLCTRGGRFPGEVLVG